MPRHLHRAVLRLLRPAEAAARRLVIVAARDIVVTPPPASSRRTKANPLFVRNGVGTGIVLPPGMARPGAPAAGSAASRSPGLPLFDPMRAPLARRWPKPSGVPRISFPGLIEPFAIARRKPPMPGDPVDATRLALRVAAVGRVLDDLPGHARRFARWRCRNLSERNRAAHETARPRFRRLSPLRPGRPPGSPARNSRRPAHEVHEILSRAHGLAFFTLAHPDTS